MLNREALSAGSVAIESPFTRFGILVHTLLSRASLLSLQNVLVFVVGSSNLSEMSL